MSRHSGATHTLETPAGTLTFNPSGYTGDGLLTDYDGVNFGPDIRPSRVSRPQTHGSYADNGYEDGIVGYIKGTIHASTAAGRATLEDSLLQCLRSTLGEEGTGTLKWTEPGSGVTRQIRGLRLIDRVNLIGSVGPVMAFQFQMAAERSTTENQTETTTTGDGLTGTGGGLTFPEAFPWSFTGSAGGQCVVTNSGTATAYPILRIYGSASAPVITHIESGKTLTFSGSVGAGDYLEVDLFERTVKLNGTTNRINLLDIANTTWFGLTRGTNTLRMSAGSFDGTARVDVLSRHAYAA